MQRIRILNQFRESNRCPCCIYQPNPKMSGGGAAQERSSLGLPSVRTRDPMCQVIPFYVPDSHEPKARAEGVGERELGRVIEFRSAATPRPLEEYGSEMS